MDRRWMCAKRALRVAAGCLALGLVCTVARATGPEIAFSHFEHLRSRTFVMDADGSNVTQIHQGEKFRRGSSEPSWSPSGEWIALMTTDPERQAYAALFRVRPDGSGLTEMLCGVGTNIDGDPYESVGGPQWSPDGAWILLRGGDGSLAIVGSDETVAADCHSNLIPLYQWSYDPVTDTGWSLLGTPAWNHDGTAIAAIVTYVVSGAPIDTRLYRFDFAVLEGRPYVSGETTMELPVDLQAVVEASQAAWDLDWQRYPGELLTFTIWESTPEYLSHVVWLDSSSGAWGYLIGGRGASWSPDNSRIVLDQESTISVCELAYDTSGVPSVVSCQSSEPGYFADWKREPLPVSCSGLPGACDDGNECTADSCSTEGICLNVPVEDATPCNDGFGLCFSGVCETPECWDDNDCAPAEICVGGICISNCRPKGAACTTGDECCSGQCHPVHGTCK